MDLMIRIAFVLLAFVGNKEGLAFHGSMLCPQNEKTCDYSRGHYRFKTIPSDTDGKFFKVFDITKDGMTTFDITFIVKNVKNLDPIQTMLSLGVKNAGPTDKFYYTSGASAREKIVHYQGVTRARIAILSYQAGVTLDVYYFMDCGFKMSQFARIDYPDRPRFTVPILKMLGVFSARQIVETDTSQKTCWFVIPKDGHRARGKIDTTYILLNNASVAEGGKIKVTDAITGKSLLSYPGTSFTNDIAVSNVRKSGNVSVQLGASKSLATAVFFVDLICTTPWNQDCKRKSKFNIMFKPLSHKDKECLRSEDYCKFGFRVGSPQNLICQRGDRVPADNIFTNNIGLGTTHCPGVKDLLNAVSLSWMHGNLLSQLTGGAIPPQSERRMGTFGKCTNLGSYCSSIRACSRQGGCGYICLMCHIRGICESIVSYYPLFMDLRSRMTAS